MRQILAYILLVFMGIALSLSVILLIALIATPFCVLFAGWVVKWDEYLIFMILTLGNICFFYLGADSIFREVQKLVKIKKD